jgi:hypothetical protein
MIEIEKPGIDRAFSIFLLGNVYRMKAVVNTPVARNFSMVLLATLSKRSLHSGWRPCFDM